MQQEVNIRAFGRNITNLGNSVQQNANNLTNLANNRNELIDRLDIIDNNIRNVREIGEQNQRSIRELHESVRSLDEKMIVRVSNSNNIVETAVIYYIRVKKLSILNIL